MADLDLRGLSDADLTALESGDLTKLSPQGLEYLHVAHAPVNTDHDVPFGGGVAKDGSTVYFDRSMPATVKIGGRDVDPRPFIRLHEMVEWSHMQAGKDYNHAHTDEAEKAEDAAWKSAGFDPAEAQRALAPWLHRAQNDTMHLPPNLDTRPYDEDHPHAQAAVDAASTDAPTAQQTPAPSAPLVGGISASLTNPDGSPMSQSDLEAYVKQHSYVNRLEQGLGYGIAAPIGGLIQRAGSLIPSSILPRNTIASTITGQPGENVVERAGRSFADYFKPEQTGVPETAGEIAGGVGAMGAGGKLITGATVPAGLSAPAAGANALWDALKGVPYLGRLVPGAAAGAAYGATQPTAPGESALPNVEAGAATGAAGSGIASILASARQAVGSRVTPFVQALYDEARRLGVPVNAAQATDNNLLKSVNSLTKTIPGSGAVRSDDLQQLAFNRAAGRTAGIDSSNLSPDVLDSAAGRIGANIEGTTTGQTIQLGKPFEADLRAILDKENRSDDPNAGVVNRIKRILGEEVPNPEYVKAKAQVEAQLGPQNQAKVMQVMAQTGLQPTIVKSQPLYGPTMEGERYQEARSDLGKDLAKAYKSGDVRLASSLRALQDAYDNAASRSLPGDKAAALEQARTQYRNLMTLREAASDDARGNINPSKLSASVFGNSPNPNLADIAQIGNQFVKPGATVQPLGRIAALSAVGGAALKLGLPTATALAIGGARFTNTLLQNDRLTRLLLNTNTPEASAAMNAARRYGGLGGAALGPQVQDSP